MTRFPSLAHLASWAGLCPGNAESAGKPKIVKNAQRKPILATRADSDTMGNCSPQRCLLSDHIFFRIAHGGMKKAAIAVAHKILQLIHRLLSSGCDYIASATNGQTPHPAP